MNGLPSRIITMKDSDIVSVRSTSAVCGLNKALTGASS